VPELVVGRGLPVVEPLGRNPLADRVRSEGARRDAEEAQDRPEAEEDATH